jgi:putative endonuclease
MSRDPRTTGSRSTRARPSTVSRGRRAEQLAVEELVRLGYRILATNVRLRHAEIDAVALDGRALCFIEVRSRSQDRFGSAEESIDARKQRRLIAGARELLARGGWPRHERVRFDVVAIDARGEPARLRVIQDAFYADSR